MQKLIWSILLCLGWSVGVPAQEFSTIHKKALITFQQAREAFREGKTEKALLLLEKASGIDSHFSEIYLLQADIYQKQGKKREEAMVIEKAMALDSLKRHPFYFFILADYYFDRENYRKARDYYRLYLVKDSRKRAEAQALRQLQNCEFALEATQTQVKQPVETYLAFDKPVYWPSLDVTGSTLLFTQQTENHESIWMLKDSICYPLGCNIWGNAGAPSLTADGRMMYFSMDGGRNGFDIYVSYRLGDTLWSEPINLGEPINTEGWEAQPAISADGTRLYFASTREGGRGGSDIWFSRLLRTEVNGFQVWSHPRCLYFNTTGDEMAPFLYFDNKSLFFSSNGYPGMGRKDIYKVDVEKVNKPQHIGITVNTSQEELGFVVDASGHWGYFSSDVSGKKCIYRYYLQDSVACQPAVYIRFEVEDEIGNRMMPDQLTVVEIDTGDTLAYYDYPYVSPQMLACVPAHKLLLVSVLKKGYVCYSDTLSVLPFFQIDTGAYRIRLQQLTPDRSFVLKGIFFDVDHYRLKPESIPQLQQFVAFMRLNPEVKIEISGHTDNTGDNDHNYRLSEDRAFEVYKYLFIKHIAKERMTYKGYGKDRPLAPNDTEEGRARNRRTEVRVKN